MALQKFLKHICYLFPFSGFIFSSDPVQLAGILPKDPKFDLPLAGKLFERSPGIDQQVPLQKREKKVLAGREVWTETEGAS